MENSLDDLLQNGWDGHIAAPIKENYIKTAKDLLALLPDGVEIFPTENGDIRLEMEENYIYLEITVNERINLYWCKANKKPYSEGRDDFCLNDINLVSDWAHLLLEKKK